MNRRKTVLPAVVVLAAGVFALPGVRAVAATCGPTPPSPGPCEYWSCVGDTWELFPRPAGTTCNDNNACTYADQCDGMGTCRGTIGCVPAGPCEVCNGTSACGKLAAGTACPSSPTANPCEAVCDGASPYCQPL